jgi:UDP-N-acetylglucosamine 2-epimerase (non-hydrolysing)
MIIDLICAARPNFMKVAPLYHALIKEKWAKSIIVHTGQHYDLNMSDVFFKDLQLPEPDYHLGIGSGSHAEQTGKIMIAYEQKLLENRPDLVVVVGDVNSTMAATIAASKLSIKVAHLEAGLRSYDRTMPEEINRIVTDSLADYLWVPSPDAIENLQKEGITNSKIAYVGNIMIDSLEMLRSKIEAQKVYEKFGMEKDNYVLITLHRPSNVDDPHKLEMICDVLTRISKRIKIIFPIHPRTQKNLQRFDILHLLKNNVNIILPEPLGYVQFMNLLFNCRLAITDSGGLQEETTYLKKSCLTLRPNTERPITITQGSNQLCEIEELAEKTNDLLNNFQPQNIDIKYWDGKTASRIVAYIKDKINK